MNVLQVIFKNKRKECQKFSRNYAAFAITYFKANNVNWLTQNNVLKVSNLILKTSEKIYSQKISNTFQEI